MEMSVCIVNIAVKELKMMQNIALVVVKVY